MLALTSKYLRVVWSSVLEVFVLAVRCPQSLDLSKKEMGLFLHQLSVVNPFSLEATGPIITAQEYHYLYSSLS